jgi:hypothetical protein
MWLKDRDQPDARQSEVTFKVDLPQVEMENPRMNEELLRSLAASGGPGGRYYTIDHLSEIPPQLTPKEEKLPHETPLTLWDRWPLFAIFALLITLEWVLRKRGKML